MFPKDVAGKDYYGDYEDSDAVIADYVNNTRKMIDMIWAYDPVFGFDKEPYRANRYCDDYVMKLLVEISHGTFCPNCLTEGRSRYARIYMQLKSTAAQK